jgi:hypothetical protein
MSATARLMAMGAAAAQGQPALSRFVGVWKVSRSSGSGALLDLTGWGHDAQLGSSAGADAADPLPLFPTGYVAGVTAGTPYVYFPGTPGNYLSAPDSVPLSFTGDFTIEGDATLATWTPAAIMAFGAKGPDVSGQSDYELRLNTDGTLSLEWSIDGTSPGGRAAASTAAVPFSAGQRGRMRAGLDVDNGAGGRTARFFTSTDGITWTPLGSSVTVGSTTSVFNSANPLHIGAHDAGVNRLLSGSLHRLRIYNSDIGSGSGTPVFDADPTDRTSYASALGSLTEKSTNAATVTINRSATGRKISVVDQPLMQLATDDYLEIPAHAHFDINATDELSILFLYRAFGAPAGYQALMGNAASFSGASPGWFLYRTISSGNPGFQMNDGTTGVSVSIAASDGILTTVAARRVQASDQIQISRNGGAFSSASDLRTGSSVISSPLRIGRLGGGGGQFGDFEFMAAGVCRRALSDAEFVRAGVELLAA